MDSIEFVFLPYLSAMNKKIANKKVVRIKNSNERKFSLMKSSPKKPANATGNVALVRIALDSGQSVTSLSVS